MLQKTIIAVAVLSSAASMATAGTISKGTWSPAACGSKPAAPAIDQSTVDAYNKSVKAINDWQQKANDYNSCLINEANADNALIAKTANDEQNQLRETMDKIKAETDAAKAKLDGKQ